MPHAIRTLLGRGYWSPEPGAGGGGPADPNDPAPAGDDPKGEGDDPKADPKADPKGEDDDPKGDPKGDPKDGPNGDDPQMTDREAELLRDVMKKKERLREIQEKFDALQSEAKKFEGLDPEKAKEALDAQKEQERKKLEKEGEWEKLKNQMLEEHNAEMERLRSEIQEKEAANTQANEQINKLTIGHAFDSSQFINDELALTPGKTRIIYGDHFDIDKNGKVVAYDKPRGVDGRTPYVDGRGEPLGFDAAIKKIVEADPDSDHMIRSRMKAGSGSSAESIDGEEPKKSEYGQARIQKALSSN